MIEESDRIYLDDSLYESIFMMKANLYLNVPVAIATQAVHLLKVIDYTIFLDSYQHDFLHPEELLEIISKQVLRLL